jgi:hypothetical protein
MKFDHVNKQIDYINKFNMKPKGHTHMQTHPIRSIEVNKKSCQQNN